MKRSSRLGEIPSLCPLNFFAPSLSCRKKKIGQGKALYLLPHFTALLSEEHFADLYLAWTEQGISVWADIAKPFEKSNQTDWRRGDSLELFFDLRATKARGFLTRYCHHFVFFADHSHGMEVSRFKFDDMHLLCDAALLEVQSRIKTGSYSMDITIGKEALFGFDPNAVFSFAYRLNRYNGYPQHFCAPSEEAPLEKRPDLWAEMHFCE